MQIVNAIVQSYKLDEVRSKILENDIRGLTVAEVKGFGRQRGHSAIYRGAEYNLDFIPKVMLTILVPDNRVKQLEKDIIAAANTGEIGAGIVWTTPIDSYTRIRTQEKLTDDNYV